MNIAVFFGGRSCEHDISIITGVQVLNALGDGYRVLPVYMKDGGFLHVRPNARRRFF